VSEKPAMPHVCCRLGPVSVPALVELEQESDFPRWQRSHFEAEFKSDVGRVFGIRTGGQLVGFCSAHILDNEAHILNVVIKKKYRGQGLGRAFLRDILVEFHSQGVAWVLLEVRENNRIAKTLYESLGFLKFSSREAYYKDTGEAAICMKLNLLEFFNAEDRARHV